MRLYVTPRGSWAGTQADAKALAKAEGTIWVEREVPTDKAGLLAFLNQHQVGPVSASHDTEGPGLAAGPEAAQAREVAESVHEAPEAANPGPDPKLVAAGEKVRRDIQVEEEIAQADLPSTIRLADHVMWRLNEHLTSAKALNA